jgi:hypothetical protein
MPRSFLPFVLTALGACAGTLYAGLNGTSTATPDLTYQCVQDQLATRGYTHRLHYDISSRWIQSQRTDSSARVSDVRFRRRNERLDFQIHPNASGTSTIEVKAQTIDIIDNQQGVSEVEQSASDAVKRDAAAILQACNQ